MVRWVGIHNTVAARRIIPAVESGLGIPTFPSTSLALLARDKIYQQMLLDSASVPTPRTWVFFREEDALDFSQEATYPLVVKTSSGFGSDGVTLVRTRREAEAYVREMFRFGVTHMYQATGPTRRRVLRRARQAVRFLAGEARPIEREGSYAFFQEFLPGNEFDTRVVIIGRYAAACRRMNRPGDFRASGSGRNDADPSSIDLSVVRFAYSVSRSLNLPFVAVDVFYREGQPVVCELNFAYLVGPIAKCPCLWFLDSQADVDAIERRDEPISPEVLTLTEFLRLHSL